MAMEAWRLRWVFVAATLAFFVRWVLVPPPSPPHTIPEDLDNKLQSSRILLTPDFIGPESLAFDPHGRGPYTGVADGRIMLWNEQQKEWKEFAHTSPERSEICDPGSPPVLKIQLEHICGRPLGMRFDKKGDLYVADAYFGLHVVGPEGGLAKAIVTEAEGTPLAFTNDVEFDDDGFIYFTDSSSKYHRRDFVTMFVGGDESGRLLRYDPSTGETKVLVRGLKFPNGIAISEDNSYLVMSETLTCRIMRYWLKGPKKGELELFSSMPGYPDNVRRAKNGDFFVAIHSKPNIVLNSPLWIRRALLKLPVSLTSVYTKIARKLAKGMVIRLSPDGAVVEVLEDRDGKVVRLVSEVEEHDGKLWMGSVILPQIAIYSEK